MQVKEFINKKEQKLSKAIALELGLTYKTIQKSIRQKDVLINNVRTQKDVLVKANDVIKVYFVEEEKYQIIYEDANVLVVNKGQNIDVYELETALKPYGAKAVHRLDRNTFGIIIFAKNNDSYIELLQGFKQKAFEKYYDAVVVGTLKDKTKILTAYLEKNSNLNKVYINLSGKGSLIKTEYSVIKEFVGEGNIDYSLLKIRLHTGKTHQIRAHLAFIGNPILGDNKYGNEEINKLNKTKRQMLSASKLVLHFSKNSKLNYLDNKSFSVNNLKV